MKAGDIDPRGKKENCYSISDKARAIGGGVLEAIMYHFNR
jgi:xanthine dehydrogenase accessory factor